jgi:lambda family phage portal protein
LAVDVEGNPDELFKVRARQLWDRWSIECDSRGFPGYGGQNITGILEQVLREVVLCGECFIHFVPLTDDEAASLKLTIPFVVQVIEAERVREDISTPNIEGAPGNAIFRGIEYQRDSGRRIAYHIFDQNPRSLAQPFSLTSKRVPAEDILHVFVPTRPGQMRGISWFAPVVDSFKLVANMQFYEQVAAAVNACMALVWETPPTGGGAGFGLNGVATTDGKGNAQSIVEPGTILTGPPGAKLGTASTSRPNLNITEFVTHVLRGIAASFPLKSSQVTNDYRGASFSSEAACELDLWHSVLSLHDWFSSSTVHPMYERLILTARLAGYFKGFESQLAADPYALKLTDAQFPPPEIRSINPNNDILAAWTRIKTGVSSITQEAAKLGNDPYVIIEQNAAYRQKAIEAGLPDPWALTILGVDTVPVDASPKLPDGSKEKEAPTP